MCRHLPALWQAGARQAKRIPEATPYHIALRGETQGRTLVVYVPMQPRFGFQRKAEVLESKQIFSVILADPDNVQAKIVRRISLTRVARDERNLNRRSGLKLHQRSDMNGIQGSNGRRSLNDLFSPA